MLRDQDSIQPASAKKKKRTVAVVVVTDTHWKYVCTNLESSEILNSLNASYQTFALVGALLMTMVFSSDGVNMGDCDPESVWVRRYNYTETTDVPQQLYQVFLGTSFVCSMVLLVFAVIGILYVTQIPKEGGRNFVRELGPFWFNFPQMIVAVAGGCLPMAAGLQYSCVCSYWVFGILCTVVLSGMILILAWALRVPAISFNVYEDCDVRHSVKEVART